MFGLCLIVGAPLAAIAGPASSTVDTDSDGVADPWDNCRVVSNAGQADADHNGCGDACTAAITCDGNGDTIIGNADLSALIATLGNNCNTNPNLNCDSDCDGNNIVGNSDVSVLIAEFGNKTGPSGITTTQCDPGSCQCTPQ
jgi:hypothetical protein